MGPFPQVIGNWKMHGTRMFVHDYLSQLQQENTAFPDQIGIAICPPFHLISELVIGLRDRAVRVGAQDLSDHASGAYTGDISAEMLVDMGASLVIVGHSERRIHHGETDALIVAKVKAALDCGLQAIVCVGETKSQRDAGNAQTIVSAQLALIKDLLHGDNVAKCAVAYEPVWAIGTGQTATPEQAQEMHAHIRAQLGAVGERVSILYGGSVNKSNAAELFAQPDINGGLIGGASLDVDEFIEICKLADQNLKG